MITDRAYRPTGDRETASGSGFRPDIEGLRALAVLLVIGAHFAVPGLSAGFIGVDVFFVISGYLITGILVREHEAGGTISLSRFYANRLRRLFPALATMLIVSSVLAFALLPARQNLAHSEAAAMATLWVSNIYFAFADIDYFGAETSGNAFLHTWSLGVEEQFYLVWPLLILAVTQWAKNGNRTSGLIRLFAFVTASSLAVSVFASYTQPIFGFYMMPTRAWQFAAGALVWLLVQERAPNKFQAAMLSWCGALLLIAALVVIGPNSTYPGLLAMLPTLGTCALLWSGSCLEKQHSPGALLTLRPVQAIGRLSYAWYLWHWPVLIIGAQLLPIKGNVSNTLLAISVSLLAAILTHHLIENPIRYGRPARIKEKPQIAVALFAMLLLSSQFTRWNNENNETVTLASSTPVSRAMADMPIIYQHGCDDYFRSDTLKPCSYGDHDAPNTAVLFGDSIGAQWFPTLANMYDSKEWKIVVFTKSSCPMVDEPYFLPTIGREYTECAVWRERAIGWLEKRKVNSIFMGGSAARDFKPEQWVEGTRRILDRLAPNTDAIYLIESTPTLAFHGPDCLSRNTPEKCQSAPANPQYPQVAAYLQKAAALQPKARWIETSSFVCPAGTCHAMRDDVFVFRDSQHLTASFAALAAPSFLHQIRQYGLPSP